MKCNEDMNIKYKVILVAKGFTKEYVIDYHKTFAPVAKLNTTKVPSLNSNLN